MKSRDGEKSPVINVDASAGGQTGEVIPVPLGQIPSLEGAVCIIRRPRRVSFSPMVSSCATPKRMQVLQARTFCSRTSRGSPVNDPLVLCESDRHVYKWPELSVELTSFNEKNKEVSAYIKWLTNKEHPERWRIFDHGRLNLSVSPTRDTKIKKFHASVRTPDLGFEEWESRLIYLTDKSLQQYKNRSEPEEDVREIEFDRSQPASLLEPLIASEDITMLFAAPAAGKSMLSTAMALSLSTGLDLLGTTPVKEVNCLYLDWEDSRSTFRMRCESLLDGFNRYHLTSHPMPAEALWYKRMSASITDEKDVIKEIIKRREVGCLFVDSLSLAGGDPNDVHNALSASQAIREFGIPTVILHHMSKAASQSATPDPYGSVFNTAAPRLAWSLAKHQEEGAEDGMIQLTNYKSNRSKKFPTRVLEINYTNDTLGNLSGVYYKQGSVMDFVEVNNMPAKKMTVREAIYLVLRDDPDHYSIEGLCTPVSELLGQDYGEEHIRVELDRGRTKGEFRVAKTVGRKNYWTIVKDEKEEDLP